MSDQWPDWPTLTTTEGAPTMLNTSKAVFLLNDRVRAVECVYEAKNLDDKKVREARKYVFKWMGEELKPGDHVVVKSSYSDCGLAIALVTALDVPVDYDANDFQMAWIIQKVDLEPVHRLEDMERTAISTIKKAEDLRRRKQLRESVLDAEQMETLQITHAGEDKGPEVDPGPRPGATVPEA